MNIAEEIGKLRQLHRDGALTDEEFAAAKAGVLAGESSGGGGGGVTCYKCDAVPKRSCALCGHMFCGEHGGERWVWLAKDGSKHGARNNLTKRVICDGCTPNPTAMKVSVVLALFFFAAVLGLILFGFSRFL